jgi:protein-S-isoprenylcysteine O-methyltransferase Ste14
VTRLEQTDQPKKPSYRRIVVRACLFVFLLCISIFVLAGRVNYWQGWLFVAAYLSFLVLTLVLLSGSKDLLKERLRPGPGTKWWDRLFVAAYVPASLSTVAVAALDAGRFRWTGRLPPALYLISYLLLFLAYAAVVWAMRTNRFFSRVVRIQTDRGHYVVRNGPYRFVRHPGYLAGSFSLFTMPLALGSLWALIPAALAVILIIIRTYLEDNTLQNELPGYADYAKKVKFRLLPGLW